MEIQPSGSNPQPDSSDDSLRKIFFNPRGLRPGWRFLIAIALIVVITTAVFGALRVIVGQPKRFNPSLQILSVALQFLVMVLVSWIMSRIERRDMGEYGLPLKAPGTLPRFVRGYIFWGFLPLSLVLLAMRALRVFYFGNFTLHGGLILFWAAFWGVFFILVGLNEEYTLRGYLLYTLAEGIGFWPAAVVMAALFALLHTINPGESRIGIIMTALFALFASVTLRYTGNLWLAVGAHAGWDWGESYFYGVSDSGFQAPGHLLDPHIQGAAWLSGGTVGPEGSLLTLVLMVTMSTLFVFLYRRSREPVLIVGHFK